MNGREFLNGTPKWATLLSTVASSIAAAIALWVGSETISNGKQIATLSQQVVGLQSQIATTQELRRSQINDMERRLRVLEGRPSISPSQYIP